MLRYIAAVLFATQSFATPYLMANPSYQNVSISSLPWTTDYQAAVSKAKAEKKPLLLFFTGSDWCSWCHKLEQEVFNTPEFAQLAGNKFIFVEIDFPKKEPLSPALKQQNDQLQKKYNIKSYPTVVLVDPSTDKVLATTGYQAGGPQKYAAHLETYLSQAPQDTFSEAQAQFESNESQLEKGNMTIEEAIAPLVHYLANHQDKEGWRMEATIAEVYSDHQNTTEALKWAKEALSHAPSDSKDALNKLIAELEAL